MIIKKVYASRYKFICEVLLNYTWWFLQLFVAAIFLTHTPLHLHRLIMYFMTSNIGLAGRIFSKNAISDPQWEPRSNYIKKWNIPHFKKVFWLISHPKIVTNTRYWEITYECRWRYRYLHSLVHFHCLFGILLVLQIHPHYNLGARQTLGRKNSDSISSCRLNIFNGSLIIFSTILI